MEKISKTGKNEMLMILEELVLAIINQRSIKDANVLRHNEKEAREWLEYVKSHDKKEDLCALYKNVSKRVVFVFDVMVTYRELKGADTVIDELFEEYANLNRIRLNLMDEFLLCCDKYLCC